MIILLKKILYCNAMTIILKNQILLIFRWLIQPMMIHYRFSFHFDSFVAFDSGFSVTQYLYT